MFVELIWFGYVCQDDDISCYCFSICLVVLGFCFFVFSGVVDLVQLVFDGFVWEIGELVCLGVIEGDCQIWIVKFQGVIFGLCYDFDMGCEVLLFYIVFGYVWLVSLSDKVVLVLVECQGVGVVWDFGFNVLCFRSELLCYLKCVCEYGYVWQIECLVLGMVVMVVLVCYFEDGWVFGVFSVVGLSVCFGEVCMYELVFLFLVVVQDLFYVSQVFELFC